jgi:CRP/FNR family transcriptional regulator, cyclic AMP receptor protein
MEANAMTALLGYTWFGWDLVPGVRARLATAARVERLPAGSVLVHEGRSCESLGVVVDGRVALRLAVPGQPDRTILTLEPGDVFGWSAVLSTPVATATCVTAAETTAILFDRAALLAVLEGDHEVAAAVYRRLLSAVASRLSATRMQLLDLYRVAEQAW